MEMVMKTGEEGYRGQCVAALLPASLHLDWSVRHVAVVTQCNQQADQVWPGSLPGPRARYHRVLNLSCHSGAH